MSVSWTYLFCLYFITSKNNRSNTP